ncbi:hypothetical protein SEA_SHAGRAT_34 [Rhodococcus phage Shagrat]|nr:hypothetical protein SEA_SHAGRAT_34 [Rhodococcus phage Shagrat]
MRVFSLRAGGGIGAPMELVEKAKLIEAYDSTGYLVATAHYIHGTGWVIVKPGHKEVLDTVTYKPDARVALRKVVGQG